MSKVSSVFTNVIKIYVIYPTFCNTYIIPHSMFIYPNIHRHLTHDKPM